MWEPSAGAEGTRRDALCDGWAGTLSEPLPLHAPGHACFHATMSEKVLAGRPHAEEQMTELP